MFLDMSNVQGMNYIDPFSDSLFDRARERISSNGGAQVVMKLSGQEARRILLDQGYSGQFRNNYGGNYGQEGIFLRAFASGQYFAEERAKQNAEIQEASLRKQFQNELAQKEEVFNSTLCLLETTKIERDQAREQTRAMEQTLAGTSEALVKLHERNEKLMNHLRSTGLNDSQIEAIING